MGIYQNLSNENKITWDLKKISQTSYFAKVFCPFFSSSKHKPVPSDVISPEESGEAVGAAAIRAGPGTTITEKWTRYSRREQL